MKLFDGGDVFLVHGDGLRNQRVALFVRHAAEVDGLERDAALHGADDVARVREEEQRLERRILRVLVRLAGFLDRHDVCLEARRRDLQQQLLAQRVLRDVVVAAHNAVAARNLRPNGRDLAVNQTIVDAAECDFHDVCSPFAGSR